MVFLNKGIEDVIFCNLFFDSGTSAHIHAGWLSPKKVRIVTVVGSKKMAIWDDISNTESLVVIDQRIEYPDVGVGYDNLLEYKTVCMSGEKSVIEINLSPPLNNECDHFLNCVRNNLQPRTDGRNGERVVRVLEALTKSMRSGNRQVSV